MPIRGALLILALLLPAASQDRADLKRARAALRTGQYVTAQRLFDGLSQRQPDRWTPHRGLVRALSAQGKYDEAAKACEAFLRKSPDHASARIARAEVDLLRGRAHEALKGVEGLHQDVRARSAAALALSELDRTAEAVKTAEPLVEIYNRDRDEFMKAELLATARGLILYANYAGKAEIYKQVVQGLLPNLLRADPADADVRAFLGRCFLEKYNRGAAAEAYVQALQANPQCADALVGHASVIYSAGQAEPAWQFCAEALAVNPAHEEAHVLGARIAMLQKDFPEAKTALEKGLAALPNSVRLLSLRAAFLHAQDDVAYKADVRRALEIRPKSPLPYREIARSLIMMGSRQFQAAQTWYKKALEQNPELPDLKIEYGMNCLRVGDEDTGLELLKDANTKDPFNVRVNNLVNLFRDFETKFELFTPEHYRVRMDRSERRWMEPHVRALLARAWTDMEKRYAFAPKPPILIEVFTRHSDFSVRTAGVPDLGALGACFGRVVTTLSPRARDASALPPYNWGAVLWHEMAHVFSLELSSYRVPSWLTEGLATYEESRGFGIARREQDLQILMARHRDLLRGVTSLDAGTATGDRILTVYLQGAEICAFIDEKHGFEALLKLLRAYAGKKDTTHAFKDVFNQTLEEFDKEFFSWLDARLAKFKYRRPSRETTAELAAKADGDPKAAARLAHALLAGGDAREAETYARRAVEADPENADARSALGRALLMLRRPDEAIAHLRKGSDDLQNWDALGRALAQLNRWKEAAPAFRRAAECFPGWLPDSPWLRLNEALLELDDTKGAAEAFENLVAADPMDFGNRLKLARLHEENKDWDRMHAVLSEAAHLDVRDLKLLELQATAHRNRREFKDSIDRTLAAVALLETQNPEDLRSRKAEMFCTIGEDWLAAGRKDKAREYAREALRLISGMDRARKLFDASRE